MNPPVSLARSRSRSKAAPKRLGLISLGCAKNLVDSEVMLGHLAAAGWEFVNDPAQADVIVVNTCSFIGPAREESIRAILEAAAYKKTGRLERLVVAGCMVQRYPDELRHELREVDAFINLDQLDRIVEVAEVAEVAGTDAMAHTPAGSSAPVVSSQSGNTPDSAARYLYDDTSPRRLATPPWTAYVKIAEGCDHTCSFCPIPSFRGRFRSRRPASVLREARELARRGVREINLVAQDSSHYGRDLEQRDGLAGLLEQLDDVEPLRWVRVHYLYPNTVTQRLIETMARGRRVLDYVDLPLQHAHPDVLHRMRRGGSATSHLALLGRFRAAMPAATLRSTMIVGFPGETEAEFAALLEFIREARLDHLGVFTYSHEEGTSAFGLADDVPEPLKQERRDRLMACQQRIVIERNRRRVGRSEVVLAEGAHPETEHLLVGRMRSQAPDVDGQVLINDGTARPGQFVTVRLTDTAGYDLVGGVVGPA
jgi:ribosomal protein S12 methylthiotransferase